MLTYPSFSLLFYSLTHYKLIYLSKYCLDINVKPNGLVKLQDGSYLLTDAFSKLDDLNTIHLLNAFLNMFVDENVVEELLKKRFSVSLIDEEMQSAELSPSNNPNSNAAGRSNQSWVTRIL